MAGPDTLSLPGLGPVRLVRRGDSSSLFRGRQVRFNRDVAVKLFPGHLDGPRRTRFEHECAAMGALSVHPHVVTVFDSGVDRAGGYIVSEWLGGGSFAERLAQGARLGWAEAVDVGVKLAGAVETSHRAGVVHDNLKPQNVLLSPFGDPVLSDFALGVAEATRSHDSYDTSIHAAPERLAGQAPSVPADVYALASVIVTLVLGRSPHAVSSEEPLVRVVARKDGEPPDLVSEGAPEEVSAVLRDALAAAPGHRPASAALLGRALQAAQQAAGVTVTRMVVLPETDADRAGPVGPPVAQPSQAAPVAPGRRSILLRAPAAPPLTDQALAVLGVAVDRYRGRPAGIRLAAVRAGLQDPVVVLVVGPRRSGKSTLVNAIIGDDVAPTSRTTPDPVTRWYGSGPTYRAAARLTSGGDRPVGLSRHDRGVELDLTGLDPSEIDHVRVTWPSPTLAGFTLVDAADPAPGPIPADAVVYVTPTWTDDDLQSIIRAQKGLPAGTACLTTVVVLAAFGDDGLASARAQAARLRQAPEIRRRLQTVVAVAPALAATAAACGPDDLAAVLGQGAGDAGVALVGAGVTAAGELGHELVRASGVQELRDVLTRVVVPRCELVRAGAALDVVGSALRHEPVAGSDGLAFDLERVQLGAHQLAELRTLVDLRGGRGGLRPAAADEADDLLGGRDAGHAARLRQDAGCSPDELARALADAVVRWRRLAESPASGRRGVASARTVVRTTEGMARALAGAR